MTTSISTSLRPKMFYGISYDRVDFEHGLPRVVVKGTTYVLKSEFWQTESYPPKLYFPAVVRPSTGTLGVLLENINA